MAVVVVVSNIAVQFLLGDWLTWAAFVYPIAFLVTDITNRLLGPQLARKVVWSGFLVGVVCTLIASQFTTPDGIPLTTLRIALGSGIAFLIAQMTDVYIFNRLRHMKWWHTPLISSVFASCIDTLLFFSIAFSATLAFIHPATDTAWAGELVPLLGFGSALPLWVSLAVADFGIKLLVAVIALIPFRLLIKEQD